MPKKPADERDPAAVLQEIEDGCAAVLERMAAVRDRAAKASRPASKAARDALNRLAPDKT
ncbi:hypothetical protein ACFV1N_25310 [Streptosporangium canum]|uniref:hypothetical protein n=1 Tax=Streptosporangium canum TaxID=324952 RepID=UPI00368F8AF5